MGCIYYPSRAKPELIIDIPALESYSLSRPAQRLQSRQVTPGGRAVVTGLGKKIQFLNLNIKNLSETDKNTLVDLLDNYVNGSQYTFDYVDGQGNDFYGCRLWQGDEDFVQAFYQRYEENLLLRVNPIKHIYAGSGSGAIIYRSSDGLTWTEVEDTTETYIRTLTIYKDFLYAGTNSNGKIYRSSDGLTWTEVYDSTETYIECLAVFDDYIYAGSSINGKIFRSATGANGDWAEVKDFIVTDADYIHNLAVFNGYLYAATGSYGKIFRTSDGTTWTEVYDSTETQIYCLAVFDDYIYAGSSANGKIFRSADGTTWAEVYDSTETTIQCLAVFKGYLYAGTANQGKIFRSADGTTWTEAKDFDGADAAAINDLIVFDGYLYAGTSGYGKIFRTSDGTTWTEVYDSTEASIYSLAVFTM